MPKCPSVGELRKYRVLYYVVAKLHSTDTYTLMARCLTGESTAEDVEKLNELFILNPSLKAEYKRFQETFKGKTNGISHDKNVQKSFERVSMRLKKEGLL